jgi:hypothetical protein
MIKKLHNDQKKAEKRHTSNIIRSQERNRTNSRQRFHLRKIVKMMEEMTKKMKMTLRKMVVMMMIKKWKNEEDEPNASENDHYITFKIAYINSQKIQKISKSISTQ